MSRRRVRRAWGLLVAAALSACAAAAPPAGSAAAASPAESDSAARPSIAWRGWSSEAFREARGSKRLVLLDLTTTWCHSCRVMAESTYTDPLVVATVNAGYVPIRVDHDRRPDVGDRYLSNGWPTTAVLGPEGHLLASTTALPAHGLREFLAQATRFYRMNRSQIDLRVAEAERSVRHTWDPDTLEAPMMPAEEYVTMNLDALRDLEDTAHGGFGTAPKTARWDAISFLLRAADARRDDRIRALAVRSAAAALALQDSVDGGFFRAALGADWSRPRYERLLSEQASAIAALGRVWRATGEHRFREAASRAKAYASALRPTVGLAGGPRDGGPERALWRGSTGPDVRADDGSWIEGDVYFGLSAAARGPGKPSPPLSPAVLTDAAASFASAALWWNRWSGVSSLARDSDVMRTWSDDRGIVADLSTLWTTMSRGDGSFYHAAVGDDRPSGAIARDAPGLLADQAAMGAACLDAYEATRDDRWLARADSVAAWMRANLEDPIGGGFRYAPRDTSAVGRLKAGDKPETANARAATFFLRLSWLTGKEEHRRVAQRTSDYLRGGPVLALDPVRAELVLLLATDPVRLVVTGDGPKAQALWEAARTAPGPDVVVRAVAGPPRGDGRVAWPDGLPKDVGRPAVYRWTRTGWRGPVTDPARIADLLDAPAAR